MSTTKTLLIAAGGTGGHIFPALSAAVEIRAARPDVKLHWIGTERSREREVCESNHIPLTTLPVTGLKRSLSPRNIAAGVRFVGQILRVWRLMGEMKPGAVLAFGGYVSAPVLAAALLRRVPFFCHEQNAVPGMVNRIFSRWARATFISFPIAAPWKLDGNVVTTGMPVRVADRRALESHVYPEGIDRSAATILITGGSQGALNMNRLLVPAVEAWAAKGYQIVWQTGDPSFQEIQEKTRGLRLVTLFRSLPDLYPYYALSRVVVARAGASTLAEVAYFGLPCVLIPLPHAAENHQWMNAGVAEAQGWAIRVRQDEQCGELAREAVLGILRDTATSERMSRKSLDNTHVSAASEIARITGDALK